MQSPCGPGAYTLAEKNAKKNKNVSKNTASSSKQYYLLEYLVFFVKNQPTKKTKNRGKKLEKLLLIRRTVVPGIRITSRTLWTTTNKLEAGPAAKGRDNEGQMRRSHVCTSSVLSRRATSPAPAQRKNCRYFST